VSAGPPACPARPVRIALLCRKGPFCLRAGAGVELSLAGWHSEKMRCLSRHARSWPRTDAFRSVPIPVPAGRATAQRRTRTGCRPTRARCCAPRMRSGCRSRAP
jgi:hypothetical protein